MKALALLSLLFLKLWGVSESNPFRCLLFRGKCVVSCPPDMHSYHTRCDEDTVSQRTCAFPYTYTLGFTCGWSRCDCNNGLILDEDTGLCVQQDKCGIGMAHRRRSRKKYRPKKLKLTEDEDSIRALI